MSGVEAGARFGRSWHDLGLWLRWTLANGVGMAAGGVALDAFGPIGAVLFGALAGGAQHLVLRRYRQVTWRWLAATTIGNLIGWISVHIVGFFVLLLLPLLGLVGPTGSLPVGSQYFLGAIGAVGGAWVGMTQQNMVFDRQSQPANWIAACSLGGAVAGAISGLDLVQRMYVMGVVLRGMLRWPETHPSLLFSNGATSGALFGLAYGAITGVAIVMAVRRWQHRIGRNIA